MPTRRDFLASAAALSTAPLLAQSGSTGLSKPHATLPNRAQQAVPITLSERQQRVDRVRELLAEHKLSALAITSGTSLRYFTGIRSGQSERLFAWVLPAQGSPYIVCPAFEQARMSEQLAQMPDGRQTRILTWDEDEDPYVLLTKNLLHPGPLALDERVQFVFADRLAQADAGRRVVSGVPVVAGCRAIKSPAELALMQLANEITLAVYRAAWQSAAPGISTADFLALIDRGYSQSGVRGEASCNTGASSALPHGSLKPQTIREGEIILIDDGCEVEGYQSDISRTFVYGKPTGRQQQVFEVVHRAQSAALAAARPGVACEAIDAAARKVVTDAGYGPAYRTFSHRVGHGIGMDGHEWPYLVRGNEQTLQPGMCFSDEPGIYLPGEFGIRLEDDWHVTETGAVPFTAQSQSLEHPFA